VRRIPLPLIVVINVVILLAVVLIGYFLLRPKPQDAVPGQVPPVPNAPAAPGAPTVTAPKVTPPSVSAPAVPAPR
jgi:hypothetical protein